MKNLNEAFVAAFLYLSKKLKSQRQLALEIGITPQYLNDIARGRSYGSEETRRLIAAALGYPGRNYEDFLEIGRSILDDKPIPQTQPHLLSSNEMEERGFFTVPFSDNMKLAAGEGGTIPITDEANESVIVVHGPSIKTAHG